MDKQAEIIAQQIEAQRKALEKKEQQAINQMINKDVEDRFKEFPICMRCGKQKPHDNYPLCDECWKQTDEYLQKEDQEFIQGKYFAGMNNVMENSEEDEFTNLMSNIDKYIK